MGVDLGQAADYTAVCVLEQHGQRDDARYAVRWLERWLGVSYTEQVNWLRQLKAKAPLEKAHLIVDATGVGRAVLDMLRNAYLKPTAITITGGDTVTQASVAELRVPKRDLVAAVAVALQQGRLKMAPDLLHAAMLTAELQNFRMRIDPRTAHDSYAAWREADHDDLVLALAVALWYGQNKIGQGWW
jgi:hypothetical protein